MNCPKCAGPVKSSGKVYYERGAFIEDEGKFEDEGDAVAFSCEPCGVEFVLIRDGMMS